jgi:hypothetical protein
MSIYAGMDVSDKSTICVVITEGSVIRCDVAASDPDALDKCFSRHGPGPT